MHLLNERKTHPFLPQSQVTQQQRSRDPGAVGFSKVLSGESGDVTEHPEPSCPTLDTASTTFHASPPGP